MHKVRKRHLESCLHLFLGASRWLASNRFPGYEPAFKPAPNPSRYIRIPRVEHNTPPPINTVLHINQT